MVEVVVVVVVEVVVAVVVEVRVKAMEFKIALSRDSKLTTTVWHPPQCR